MELGTLAVAVIGTVFGVGTTLITDLARSRREQDRYWNETKRAVYARFLTSLAQTHFRMIVAAFRDQPDDVPHGTGFTMPSAMTLNIVMPKPYCASWLLFP
ncbi:hypothetical protein GCM10022295_83280 [Streptomyces osmaniensis]|uniref:Secreted protein n=1 Tax=Streptomyces osmaniensis TaxID=593134 RepID=A0ABP6YRG4_9ACTN